MFHTERVDGWLNTQICPGNIENSFENHSILFNNSILMNDSLLNRGLKDA